VSIGPRLVVSAFVEKVLHLRKLQVVKINTVLGQAHLLEVHFETYKIHDVIYQSSSAVWEEMPVLGLLCSFLMT